MGVLILLAGLLLAGLAFRLLRRRRWKRLAGILLILPALATLTARTYWIWFTHRRQPAPLTEQRFPGITYQRLVFQSPRPIILHLIRADLRTPGIEILFTPVPAATYRPLKAATVSRFLLQSGAQVAINANFFYPFRAKSPFNYYPRENDPTQAAGIAAYQGLLYQPHPFAPPADPAATFFVANDGHATFTRPQTIYNAISGDCFLLKESKNVAPPDLVEPLNARTAIGLGESEQTLFLAVLDGKQPGYSEGASLPEFADLLLHAGIHTAIDLDGGGSSTLVAQSPDHQPQLISSPTNFRMPWWERPVANHLGIKVPLP